MNPFLPRDSNYSLPPYPSPSLGGLRSLLDPGSDPVYIDGHYVYPPSLPQHARCPHIQANRKCGDGCYSYYTGTGDFNCSNLHCLGHRSLWSSACYTRRRLQPLQHLPLSVLDDLRDTHPSRLERYMADKARMPRLTEDIADDNWGPSVLRRAPWTPVVVYDNDGDNVLETAREDLHASLMEGAPRPRSTMQKASAKAVPKRRQAIITHAEEAEQMVEAIENIMRKERIHKRSAEQDKKAHGKKAFIAQMAAKFAKEERELTQQEDLYQLRDPSEDPLSPLATSMEDLMQRDAHIEARRRRVTAHEYRNSLVTSTTTPNVDNPSKSSLDNPIIEIAIDQFLTQDSEKIETLHQKLGKLCGIAMERAEKLGLEGVTEDDSYLLKHIRASKRTHTEPSWTEGSDDDVPAVSFRDKVSMSKAEGKRHVMECADAASAQCQHHSCQPIRSRSRRSSTFSDSTSYGPFFNEPEVPAVDKVKSEEPSSGQIPGYRDRSLAECVYMNIAYFDPGNPLKSLLKPIARAVYDLDSNLPQRMSDDEFEQACVNEFHKIGEYDHWKLQNAINQILQDTAPDHTLQRHCVQELRARIYDARNPKRSSDEGNNEFSEEAAKQEGKASLEQLQADIAQAVKKAEQTIKDPHDDLDKRGTPKGRIGSKYTKGLARNSLRTKKLVYRKKVKQPTVSDAADTYENLQTEKEDTSDSSSTASSSSSDPSNVVESSNRFGNMAESQRRERFEHVQKNSKETVGNKFIEDMAESVEADFRVLEKKNAETRARNNMKNVDEIKRLMFLKKRPKQPTVEDAADIEDDPLLSTRTNSSLSLNTTGASKGPSCMVEGSCSLDAPTVDSPWMGLTLPPPHSSSGACCDAHDSEVEAVLFAGRSPRSPIHSGGGDEHVSTENGDDALASGEHLPDTEKTLREMDEERERAEKLSLEEEEIMNRMEEDLRVMIEKRRKKGIRDV